MTSTLASPTQSALFRHVPTAYTWSDHDFGDNNSNGEHAGAGVAAATFRQFVPHYPLPADTPLSQGGTAGSPGLVDGADATTGLPHDGRATYQAFTIGRVRFILSDLRSQRNSVRGPSGVLLGDTQLAWLKAELLAAAESHVLVVWVVEFPWIIGGRKWGWFEEERGELLGFLATHDLRHKVLILSGDAHMLAADDGRYSPGGIPVLHASPLDSPPSTKGGPYAYGAVAGQGQFGLLTIVDRGAPLALSRHSADLQRAETQQRAQAAQARGGGLLQNSGVRDTASKKASKAAAALEGAVTAAAADGALSTSSLFSALQSLTGGGVAPPVAPAVALAAAAARTVQGARDILRLGGLEHLAGGGAPRPVHAGAAPATSGVCLVARGIATSELAARPNVKVGLGAALQAGLHPGLAGEVLRMDWCVPARSTGVSAATPPTLKHAEWAPVYMPRAAACSTSHCDVDGALPTGHPLSGVPCPRTCYDSVMVGSTFGDWALPSPPSPAPVAAALLSLQQSAHVAWAWGVRIFVDPVVAVFSAVLAPLHHFSLRARLVPEGDVQWLHAYYAPLRDLLSDASLPPGSTEQGATLVQALPWLHEARGRPAAPLDFIALASGRPNTDPGHTSCGFFDLHRAGLQGVAQQASVWDLLTALQQALPRPPPPANASAVLPCAEQAGGDSGEGLTRRRLAAAVDVWISNNSARAGAVFMAVFLGGILLLFIGAQFAGCFAAVTLVPRIRDACCPDPPPTATPEQAQQAAEREAWQAQQEARHAVEKGGPRQRPGARTSRSPQPAAKRSARGGGRRAGKAKVE